MQREQREYEEWERKRDKTLSFLKSRRTSDGNIIADDFAIQQLRDLYLGCDHLLAPTDHKIETPSDYAKVTIGTVVACILVGAFLLL